MDDAAQPRKRVRWSEEATVVEFHPDDPVPTANGDHMSDEFAPPHLEDLNPEIAAQKRAQQRRDAMLRMPETEDTAVLDDLAAAEEDYDEPEELYNDMGIPIEPFHLRRERERGFFDAAGTYIAYAGDADTDAWLEGLQDDASAIDKQLARRHAAAAAAFEAASAQQGALSDEDRDAYRARMVALMAPQETVLAALRRLGGAGARQQPPSPAANARAAPRRRPSQPPPGDAAAAADAPPQGAADGSAGGAAAPSAPACAAAEAASSGQRAAGAAASAAPGGAIPRGAAALAGARTLPREGVGSVRRRMPPEASRQFDRLTEYADALLGAGEFSIYEATREQLQRRLQAGSPPDWLDGEGGGAAAAAAAAAGVGAEGREAGELAQRGAAARGAAIVGEEARAAQDDVDMFSSEEGVAGEAGAVEAAAAAAAAAAGASGGSALPDSAASDAVMSEAGRVPEPAGGTEVAASDTSAVAASDTSAPAAAASGGAAEAPTPDALSILEGFELLDSGFYYSSSKGLYFDPTSSLFGDAGGWYRYTPAGTYQLVE